MYKSLLVLLLIPACAYAADKFKVQVVESSSTLNISPNGDGTAHVFGEVFAKVILPNGDHASLMCAEKRCALIEPVAPEKMNPKSEDCYTVGNQHTCTKHDLGEYWATRKGNWLTIDAPNGKLTFKITGSW